ncbi:MAG: hypothetical protein R3F59_12040, partial [Myxococcota bacterium]
MPVRHLLAAAVLAAPTTASAVEVNYPYPQLVEVQHRAPEAGVALLVGGGGIARLKDDRPDPQSLGGAWHIRGLLGTHAVVGGELAYVGSATLLRGVPPTPDGPVVLLSNGAEGAVRLQAPLAMGARGQDLVLPFLA